MQLVLYGYRDDLKRGKLSTAEKKQIQANIAVLEKGIRLKDNLLRVIPAQINQILKEEEEEEEQNR